MPDLIMRWRAAIEMTNAVAVMFLAGKATQADLDKAFEFERQVFAEWGGPKDDPEAG